MSNSQPKLQLPWLLRPPVLAPAPEPTASTVSAPIPAASAPPVSPTPIEKIEPVKVVERKLATSLVSWLSDDVLLLVSSFSLPEEESLTATVQSADKVTPLQTRCFALPLPTNGSHPENGSLPTHEPQLVLLSCPPGQDRSTLRGALEIRVGDRTIAGFPKDLRACLVDLAVLIKEGLMDRGSLSLTPLFSFLTQSLADERLATPPLKLSKSLFTIREALRKRPPGCTLLPDRYQGFHVDVVLKLDDSSYYMRGWVWDDIHPLTRLSALSPEGTQAELLSRISRWPRPDVDKFYGIPEGVPTIDKGFICFFEIPAPSFLPSGWLVEMENASGYVQETKSLEVVSKPEQVFQTIVEDLYRQHSLGDTNYLPLHAVPALNHLNRRILRGIRIKEDARFGRSAAGSEISVIVPLPKQFELLEHQLTQFARDPELRDVDLIYVGTDPAETQQFRDDALQLHRLYRIPFRWITLEQPVAFHIAQRIGASVARGRLLVFCNLDVFPEQPGWLTALASFYRATPGIGALGPKLLHEDDSLQHAGLYFARAEGDREWDIGHYFKGYHRLLPAANEPRVVPAVSGACLMIDRELFLSTDGYSDTFLSSPCASADLCLRLLQTGRKNWYLPSAELYNLEGMACSGPTPAWQAFYNECLFTRCWDERLG